ncbi:MAG TPA: DUF2914 domain-containing protein [Candidatus Thiothrix moscowensis]|uniref:DUF2914 domain-containing protein n=1 Tax=unclassified Thiothrix TaxID=2636184 RepID=UPI0025F44CF7|nr:MULTISPECIES: DUF2914 domain-containing protein [unclassified Thiothrix]HRJ51167.1 DUF2914 domain-containing protein [Candidatus Thiothrix moscowensis]HRJ91778.1 DUF2914 domain-containing protein [Candidatus Thiothrix moscowensis]
MPNIQMSISAGLLLTVLTTTLHAETFEHGSIITPPPASTNPAPTTPAPVTPTPGILSQPAVTRSAFTSAISGREPVDQLSRISAGQQMYYFTELTGLQGHVITHKWERNGAFQLGLQFPVEGSPWRVHSSKSIAPNLPGTWTVTVQNDDGSILKQESLQVEPVMPSAEPPTIPAPAQPLTPIPPALQKPPVNPAPAPETPNPDTKPPVTGTPSWESPAKTDKPIWETLR